MKKLIFALALLIAVPCFGQGAPPTTLLPGTVGNTGGLAILGGYSVTTSGSTYTLAPNEWWRQSLRIAGTAGTIVAPKNIGQTYTVTNAESGTITFGGSSGTTVSIAAGATVGVNCPDGANYVQVGASGSGGVPSVNGITSAVTVAAGTGIAVSTASPNITVLNTSPAIGMPAASTMLFDYQMPASDSANPYFTDYSSEDGASGGVGNCAFITSHAPTYLAAGGASFTAFTGCDVPAAANSLRSFVAMVAPVPMPTDHSYVNPTVTVLGASTSGVGPLLMLADNAAQSWGYGFGTLSSGANWTGSLDSSAGLSCVGYNIGTTGDSTTDAFFLNGLPVGSYTQTNAMGILGSGNWELGTSDGATAQYYVGNMYRAAGWSVRLTNGEMAQACQVLIADAQRKSAVNPATAPNTSTTPTLACVGDSIMAGVGGGTPPCNLLSGLPTLTVNVDGWGGSTVIDESQQLATSVVAQCTTASPNYVLMQGGTNSLANGESAASTWNDMVRFGQLVRQGWAAKGCHGQIGLGTVLSRIQIDDGNPGIAIQATITNGGSGYTGSGGTATITGLTCSTNPILLYGVSGGTVGNLNFSNIGFDCMGTPTVTIPPPSSGTTATVTMTMSSSGTGTRFPYNQLERQNYASAGFDFLVDFAANPIFGANFAFLDGTYFTGDYIHPTVTGETLMGTMASTQLNYVFNAGSGAATTETGATYTVPTTQPLTLLAPAASQAGTLPTCAGQTNDIFSLLNSQSANTTSIVGASSSEPINGLTSAIPVPNNTTATLMAYPNAGTSAGCYWSMTYSPSSGGGGDTITSPGSTLSVGGSPTNTTLDLNLGNANTWTGQQTFTQPVVAPSGVFGTPSSGAVAALPTGAHGTAGDESSTAGVPAAGVDYIRWDSASHTAKLSVNDSAESSICTIASGCGGGGDTITSPGSTLSVGGSPTNTTLDLNLGNANTWTGQQTFTGKGMFGPATSLVSTSQLGVSSTGAQTLELQSMNAGTNRSSIVFVGNLNKTSLFDFGVDLNLNGSKDFYIYNYTSGSVSLDVNPTTNEYTFGGGVNAPTGTFGTDVTVGGNNVCQSTGTNCPNLGPSYYWTLQPALFANTTVLGAIYRVTSASTFTTMTMHSTTGTCTTVPTINLLDLGTSPTTVYGSATTVTGFSPGVIPLGAVGQITGTFTVASGHYIAIGFSSGTCATYPTLDATLN